MIEDSWGLVGFLFQINVNIITLKRKETEDQGVAVVMRKASQITKNSELAMEMVGSDLTKWRIQWLEESQRIPSMPTKPLAEEKKSSILNFKNP